MILRTLTWSLLRMLLRYIRRRVVNRILDYCRRAGWPEKEIHSVRWALFRLFRLLLRFLLTGFMTEYDRVTLTS